MNSYQKGQSCNDFLDYIKKQELDVVNDHQAKMIHCLAIVWAGDSD